jgi:hypothetical protein
VTKPTGVKTSPLNEGTILVDLYLDQLIHRAVNGKISFALQQLPPDSPTGYTHRVLFDLSKFDKKNTEAA